MFIATQQNKGILIVKDEFYDVIKENDNGDIEVSFFYYINQSLAIKHSALKVEISVADKPSAFDNTNSSKLDLSNPTTVIDLLLSKITNAKTAITAKESSILSQKNSDVTSKINNELLNHFTSDRLKKEYPVNLFKKEQVLKSTNELQRNNIDVPLLQYSTYVTGSKDIGIANFIRNLINERGIDPSEITKFSNAFEHFETELIAGTTKLKNTDNISQYKTLLDSIIGNQRNIHNSKNADKNLTVSVVEQTPSDLIKVKQNVVIPTKTKNLNFSKPVVINFSLVDNNNLTIDKFSKNIDLNNLKNFINFVRRPPRAGIFVSQVSNKAVLNIVAQDNKVKSYKIYKKRINNFSNVQEHYNLITEIPAKQDVVLEVETQKNNPIIYRIIPVSESGALSPEFTNVISKQQNKSVKVSFCSIVAKPIREGLVVEVRNLPTGVVGISLVRKNRTLFEKNYTTISKNLVQVNQYQSSFSFVDNNNLKRNHIYEYATRASYRDGNVKILGKFIIEYIPFNDSLVKTTISNLNKISDAILDVSFDIETSLNDNSFETIKTLFAQNGLSDSFANELLQQKQEIKNLLAHSVARVNLTTGIREEFGIITDKTFVDSTQNVRNNIPSLEIGNSYRYEISAALRSPETLLTANKTITDITNRTYSYKPNTFLHPTALNNGTLGTEFTRKKTSSKDSMTFGLIGSYAEIVVNFDLPIVKLVDAMAVKQDSKTTLIQWTIDGDPNLVDHFLIVKQHLQTKTIIGKSHAIGQSKSFRYQHKLSSNDFGVYSYQVICILNNYFLSNSITTNEVIL